MNKRPIGIFDSGIGGLTVLKEVERVLPCENIIYFGDTARVPYGNKSKQTVIRFSTESILFLLRKKVKLVIVACNTSSSLALEYLKKVFRVPIVGVICPAVEKAISVSKKRRIGVIGTKSTINSGVYEREIQKRDKGICVRSKACPLFVPLVEEGLLEGKIVSDLIKLYLDDFKKSIDTLILGCTHYPLLSKSITSFLKTANLVDSAQETALNTRSILKAKNILNEGKISVRQFYVTDDPDNFFKLARLFLKRKIDKPRVVNV